MIAFVYKRDNKYKVLDLKKAQKEHNELLQYGWKHTSTIEPLLILEQMMNREKKIKKIKENKL